MSGWRKRQIENLRVGAEIHAGDGEYSIGTREEYEKFAKARNVSLAQARIRDLAEQAGYNIKELDVQEQMVAEKFAELIVRECVGICDKRYVDIGQDGDGWLLARQIAEHFGVE